MSQEEMHLPVDDSDSERLTVEKWAEKKGVSAFDVGGMLGVARARGAFPLYENPEVDEAEFDAMHTRFTKLSIG